LFEVVYIYVLVELINQRGKLEKSFVTIYLVYIIEEDKKETKKKNEMRKGYIRSKIYKVKSDIYKQRRRYGPKVKNKDKKR